MSVVKHIGLSDIVDYYCMHTASLSLDSLWVCMFYSHLQEVLLPRAVESPLYEVLKLTLTSSSS